MTETCYRHLDLVRNVPQRQPPVIRERELTLRLSFQTVGHCVRRCHTRWPRSWHCWIVRFQRTSEWAVLKSLMSSLKM